MKTILLTNDDGINAKGLNVLKTVLQDYYNIITVAPTYEQSGSSHSLTMATPLRITRYDDQTYSVNGTPTDCVMLAIHKIMAQKPDLLISGINDGQNMGDDVTYSGTVSAAFEGTLMGIPSLAVSLVIRNEQEQYFDDAARVTCQLVDQILKHGFPEDTLLNINIPNMPQAEIQGVVITKQGKRVYNDVIVEKEDPRGRSYYWIAGKVKWELLPNSDFSAIHENKISITPLHLDLTNYQTIPELEKWELAI